MTYMDDQKLGENREQVYELSVEAMMYLQGLEQIWKVRPKENSGTEIDEITEKLIDALR